MTRIEEIAKWIVDAYRDQLEKDDKLASGKLYRSINHYIEIDGDTFYITLELESYWKWVEDGRGPGKFPPPDKIREWIRVRHIVPRPIRGKVPTTNQLAYLIGRKIARKGTEGSHSMEMAIKRADNWIDQFCDEIIEQYKREIKEVITER